MEHQKSAVFLKDKQKKVRMEQDFTGTPSSTRSEGRFIHAGKSFLISSLVAQVIHYKSMCCFIFWFGLALANDKHLKHFSAAYAKNYKTHWQLGRAYSGTPGIVH